MGPDYTGIFKCSCPSWGSFWGGGGDGETYQPAIADAPPDYSPRVTFGADLQWEDLGRVQPWHGQPRRAEDGGEEEDEKGSCDSGTYSGLRISIAFYARLV